MGSAFLFVCFHFDSFSAVIQIDIWLRFVGFYSVLNTVIGPAPMSPHLIFAMIIESALFP